VANTSTSGVEDLGSHPAFVASEKKMLCLKSFFNEKTFQEFFFSTETSHDLKV
jgi:hypothetical protein